VPPERLDLAGRFRVICLALPEVTERLSHGAPSWFVRDRKAFVTLWADGHHGDDFPHAWCAALPGAQEELVAAEPDRFFRPPYVGGRGWLGIRLDGGVDWDEIAGLCEDAYRAVAPSRLIAELDSRARLDSDAANRARPNPGDERGCGR
jgi:hypothetical protein